MDNQKFIELAKKEVIKYFNTQSEKTDSFKLEEKDVFVVWLAKVLQNNKALISTTVSDGMYYEVTYNGDKDELYIDAYKKWKNMCVKFD